MPRSRRRFLRYVAATQAVALAGCTGEVPAGGSQAGAPAPTARLAMDAVETAELPQGVLYSIAEYDGPDRRADLMDRILDGGASVEDTRPPLPEDQHLYYDDVVYQLSHEVTAETPATMYPVKVDIVTDGVNESEAVRFADLPAVDREKFAERGLAGGKTVGIGTTFLYTHHERDRSVLVPDSEYSYVVWDSGAEAVWDVDDGHERTLKTYRYAAERVDAAAAYGRRLRERFAFELAGLSAAEREIVRTTIDEGPYVVEPEQTPSPAFWSLADRFRDREQAHGLDEDGEGLGGEDGLGGPYIVEYEGGVYWAALFVDSDELRTPVSS